jgi:predicted transcriptional regulator of viral defense system
VHEIDHLAARFAAVQAGRFTRAQVRPAATQSHGLIHSRIRTGRWLRMTSKVLALPGAPMDRMGDLWTASLHLGGSAAVSHGSAAHLHGLVAVLECPPTLTVPNGSHRRSTEFVVHQCRNLTGGDVVRVRGLPTTSLARPIVDL